MKRLWTSICQRCCAAASTPLIQRRDEGCLASSQDADSDLDDQFDLPSVTDKLTVVLAEYAALRDEIRSRSELQSRALQIHITALTGIIGVSVANLTIGAWLVFVVAIESSLFGLWYLDHRLMIERIGWYIHDHIESLVADLLGAPRFMRWEYAVATSDDVPRLTYVFNRMITFFVPAGISCALGAWLLWAETDLYQGNDRRYASLLWAAGLVATASFAGFTGYWMRKRGTPELLRRQLLSDHHERHFVRSRHRYW